MEMKLNFDCIVIGAGPAGLTAAIYLKRANLSVLVFEKEIPGGQLNYAPLIENYPGYASISGPVLANNMYEQAKTLGTEFKMSEVLDIEERDNYKVVKTKNEEFFCKDVIIATGRQRRSLNVPNEEQLVGKGISYCALCDGMFFKEKDVIVIGGGNSAIEEALSLSKIANKVTLIHRSQKFKAEEIRLQEMLDTPNIEVIYDTVITEFLEENGKVSGAGLENKITGEKYNLASDGIFISIGYGPNPLTFDKINIQGEGGYVVVNEKNETTTNGVYACGDVILKEVYQIVTAVGEGASAATSIIRNGKK